VSETLSLAGCLSVGGKSAVERELDARLRLPGHGASEPVSAMPVLEPLAVATEI